METGSLAPGAPDPLPRVLEHERGAPVYAMIHSKSPKVNNKDPRAQTKSAVTSGPLPTSALAVEAKPPNSYPPQPTPLSPMLSSLT